jgi:hypothetical protein
MMPKHCFNVQIIGDPIFNCSINRNLHEFTSSTAADTAITGSSMVSASISIAEQKRPCKTQTYGHVSPQPFRRKLKAFTFAPGDANIASGPLESIQPQFVKHRS